MCYGGVRGNVMVMPKSVGYYNHKDLYQILCKSMQKVSSHYTKNKNMNLRVAVEEKSRGSQ